MMLTVVVTIDCNGIQGCVALLANPYSQLPLMLANPNGEAPSAISPCNYDGVRLTGYGNGGVGLASNGGVKVCNSEFDPGYGGTEHVVAPQPSQSSGFQLSSEHSVRVIVRVGTNLSQDEANKIVSNAVTEFVNANHRMPNSDELEKQLGQKVHKSGPTWIVRDTETAS